MPGHSTVLQVLGTFILWVGWYGFNMGSTLRMSTTQASIAGRITITTTLAASAGGLTSILLERFGSVSKSWEISALVNGILAGLVSVTAGCATVAPWASLLMGFCGANLYRIASRLLLRLHIDDPLDAFAVHGVCGAWGVFASALLSEDNHVAAVYGRQDSGLFYGGTRPLGAAAVFVLVNICWSGSLSTALFVALRRARVLRSSDIGGPDAYSERPPTSEVYSARVAATVPSA